MCGCFHQDPRLAKWDGVRTLFPFEPYVRDRNVFPKTKADIIVQTDGFFQMLSAWFWLFDPDSQSVSAALSSPYRTFNARTESVFERKTFRDPIRNDRCIIPAFGFFEGTGSKGDKQPWFFSTNDEPMALAGIHREWHDPMSTTKQTEHSFAILTVEPNDLVAQYHDRMPVILKPSQFKSWLNPTLQEENEIATYFSSYPSASMKAHPVAKALYRGLNGPASIEPVELEMDLFTGL